MPEMKYYMVYGHWKPEYQGPEAFKKAMEKYKKLVEKAGCKVKFWGSALGVPESSLCVIKGSPEDWLKIPFGDAPFTNTRTHVVITW
jgi:hypothetical protein